MAQRLSSEERVRVDEMARAGVDVDEMARRLGRHRSTLQSVSFGYFDEVWAIRETTIGPDCRAVFVVLRLSNGGDTQQSVVVPRPAHTVADRG